MLASYYCYSLIDYVLYTTVCMIRLDKTDSLGWCTCREGDTDNGTDCTSTESNNIAAKAHTEKSKSKKFTHTV